ncbi:MAG: hypothetical protein AAFX00_02430, partial [Pseudomonadota bacterium]
VNKVEELLICPNATKKGRSASAAAFFCCVWTYQQFFNLVHSFGVQEPVSIKQLVTFRDET